MIRQDKLDHLKILVTQTDPDIVSETWLRCTVTDSEMALNNLKLFRNSRGRRCGYLYKSL